MGRLPSVLSLAALEAVEVGEGVYRPIARAMGDWTGWTESLPSSEVGPRRRAVLYGREPLYIRRRCTNEPWSWAQQVPQWGKPLAYQLVNDTGYPNYANVLAIRPADRGRLDECLHRLMPLIQSVSAPRRTPSRVVGY